MSMEVFGIGMGVKGRETPTPSGCATAPSGYALPLQSPAPAPGPIGSPVVSCRLRKERGRSNNGNAVEGDQPPSIPEQHRGHGNHTHLGRSRNGGCRPGVGEAGEPGGSHGRAGAPGGFAEIGSRVRHGAERRDAGLESRVPRVGERRSLEVSLPLPGRARGCREPAVGPDLASGRIPGEADQHL